MDPWDAPTPPPLPAAATREQRPSAVASSSSWWSSPDAGSAGSPGPASIGTERSVPVRRGGCLRPVVISLLCLVLALVLLVVAGIGLVVASFARAGQTNVGIVDLSHPLAIPPLLEPTVDAAGRKVFDLRVQAGSSELVPGRRSPTWGVNGPYLGPTVRATRGDRVVVNVTNEVDQTTTMHWHGMHLPAAMDGGPQQPIAPGTTWSPTWTIDQPAASLWYHPHPHGKTADHVYRGVAGLFLLDDQASAALPLPSRYGVDDVPLIVQDKAIAADGSLESAAPFLGNTGITGDQILVNGTWGPQFEATTERVRFRLVNASNARPYNFGFTDGRPFAVVGSDSGLLPAPVETDRLVLVPGERAEVVVEVRPGDDRVLRSYPTALGTGTLADRAAGAGDTFDILRLRGAAQLDASAALPATLVPLDAPDPRTAVATRAVRFAGTDINGRAMDPDRIDITSVVDTTEQWEVSATDAGYHVFHVHDTRFVVLDIDGAPPPPTLSGWKDTLWLEPGRQFRLLLRFEDHADPATAYMYHCHILRHEDRGMMGQLVVVDPQRPAAGGERPERSSLPPGTTHDHG